ncbi:hypothetical protein [Pseudomonas vancouverensis]|uniref:Uncharacterized protein n=1 Tax=Pseudomonas vancouverensis TaxID=95300 RepID=A0A1H2MW81_PSEVA|nr:hypothetical protein [Pseudomonas vancouverensis]KAB0489712.1 hypothetical protein F7R09_28770 [Pseudomonas vancouverensis]TDB67208.1 hypothetical protein EIY72_03940 [Pseudomonas vancouverensis]SDU96826.1 hypothetical protein SAMN05216558_1287 [Pseudomonas vancouverensis]
MANPAQKTAMAAEDLVRLRDEIAMHALNGLLINAQWGYTNSEGIRKVYQTQQEYTDQAYRLADEMLASRERI